MYNIYNNIYIISQKNNIYNSIYINPQIYSIYNNIYALLWLIHYHQP